MRRLHQLTLSIAVLTALRQANAQPASEQFDLIVNNGSGGGEYAAGTVVNVSADPAPPEFEFAQWAGGRHAVADEGSSVTSLTMPDTAVVITAIYQSSIPGRNNIPPVPVIHVMGKSIVNGHITVVSGEMVEFDGSRSYDGNGDSLYFNWTFGDGTSSSKVNPVHEYDESGDYRVSLAVDDDRWPVYPTSPFIIPIQQPALTDRGGIITADFDNDGLLDYAVSTKADPETSEVTRATIRVYSHHGTPLWVRDADLRINKGFYGLPGIHGPGLGAADVDGDNETELVHLNTNNGLVIRDGATGQVERTLNLSSTESGGDFWGQFQIVNLRGHGDRDVILQADTVETLANKRNKYHSLKAISIETGELLWQNRSYDGLRHGGFRAADLDGDGFDEVAGAVMIDHDGTRMNAWNYRKIVSPGHLDAVHYADVKPEIPGLEVVILEEGKQDDDRVAIFNAEQVFAYASRNGEEPQNAAIGEFDPNRPGLEIWCRSRFHVDQRPWVLDSAGNIIAGYALNEHKPPGWTDSGIEVIFKIDWNGGVKEFIAAKERHTDGDVAIIDAMTGEFIRTWEDNASRIYVVDVAGDYREEIITVNSRNREIRIYSNRAHNTNAKVRYWHANHYKRQKQNYNYYSP